MAEFKLNAETWATPRTLYDYLDYTLGDGPDEAGRPFPSPSLDRKCGLIAVAVLRANWTFLPDNRCHTAVELFEAFADDLDHAKNVSAQAIARHAEEEAYARVAMNRDDLAAAQDHHIIGIVAGAVSVDVFGPNEGLAFIRCNWINVLEEFNGDLASNVRLVSCIFGNPFRPVALDQGWRTEAVVGLATSIYVDRAFDRLPVLADALEDGGCANADVLAHCRGPGPHARGCWVVDLLLCKA